MVDKNIYYFLDVFGTQNQYVRINMQNNTFWVSGLELQLHTETINNWIESSKTHPEHVQLLGKFKSLDNPIEVLYF